MRFFTRFLFILLFTAAEVVQVSATHIMGGSVLYTYLGNNQYAIQFILYQDCQKSTTMLPTSFKYHIKGASSSSATNTERTIYQTGLEYVTQANSECGSNYCTKKGWFNDTITEGTDTVGYYIWNDYSSNGLNSAFVARNTDIDLKVNTATTGITLYAFMPPRSLASSSPQIVKDMTPNVCIDRTDVFSAGFYSPDNDSLVFTFVQPYDVTAVNFNNPPNFPTIAYNNGYSPVTPFGTNYKPTLDSSTGLITTNFPNTQGNYVAVVQVQEYQVNRLTHKASYIGLVRVDLEFVGVSCSARPPPAFVSDPLGYKRTVQINEQFCINVKATDTKYPANSTGTYDTLTMTAASVTFGGDPSFPKPYSTFTSTNAPVSDSGTYCWTPSCADITYSAPHTVTFQVADQSCGVATETYSIYVQPRPFVVAPTMQCISINNTQYINLQWTPIKADTNFLQYNIYRKRVSKNSPGFTLVRSFTNYQTSSWTDSSALYAQDTSYLYYIVSENKCQAEGFSSDTFESVIITATNNGYGGASLNWNPINWSYKDSFAIWVNTGTGVKQIATINGLTYNLPYCNASVTSAQIDGLSKTTTCQSQSNPLFDITVKDTIPPVKEPILYASVISWGEVDLLYTKTTSPDINHYYIYRAVNGGAFALYDSVFNFGPGTSATLLYIDKKVAANTNYYCYEVIAADNCGNKQAYSEHCTMLAKILTQQRANRVSWTPYIGFTPDTVKVQQYVNGKWITRKIDKATDTVYTDTGITCIKRYYRILAYYDATKEYALSDSVSATPIDTVPPQSPPNTLMSFDPHTVTKVDMTWLAVYGTHDVEGYKLYSWINGILQTIPTSLSTASYPSTIATNATPSGNKQFCYDYVAYDSCGNASLLHKYCTLQLINATAQNLSASLIWTPNNQTGIAKYYIQDSVIGSSNWKTEDSVVKVDTTDIIGGLHCNISYDFRVMAVLSSGIDVYSNTVESEPYDTIKPQQVNIESVTVPNTSSVKITFDKVADPVVTKYLVYSRKDNGTFTLLTTVVKPASSPISITQTGINTAMDSFSYEVFAVDSCASNTSATTQVDAPVLLTGDSGQYSATLNWTPYEGFTVGSYTIQYYAGGWQTLKNISSAVTTYTDQPIPCIPKTYRILVNPVSGSLSSVSDSITIKPYDRDSPVAPVLVSATVTGYHSILVTWQKSTSNDVNKYYLYREKSGAPLLSFYKAVGNVTSYIDSVNTDSGISYCYAVQAVDSCEGNKSLLSTTQCVVNLNADSNICYQKIYIGWTAYSGWPAGVEEYLLYRKVEGAGTDTLIATLTKSTYNYVDSTMSNSRGYCYKIVALENPGGTVTSSSNYDCSKIFQPMAPQIYSASKTSTSATNGTIVIKWKSVEGQRYYKYYQLYYKVSTASTYILLQNNIPIATDSFVQNGLNTQNLDYNYYLIVVDSCGNKTPISTVHQTMTLYDTVGQLIHHLSWTPYKGFNIKGYIVQRLENGVFVNIDTVPGNKTTDVIFPAPCNYNIFYRISAIDSFGHFAWSDTVGKKAIDTIPSNAPTFVNATVLNSDQVQLNYFGADSSSTWSYSIQRETNGVWATAGMEYFTTKHAAMQYVDNVSTLKNKHCYTIITLDSCLNATPSDTFCTITLTGTALNEADQINWTPFEGYNLKNYAVETYNNGKWGILSTLPTKDTALLHDSLHCYIPQYYRIFASEVSGGQSRVTYSDSMELIPFDTILPAAPVLQYASVQPNGSIKLLWNYNTRSSTKFFEVWRSVNGGAFDSLTTLTFDTTYIDSHVNAQDTVLYLIKAVDSCKATLVSRPSDTARIMTIGLVTGFCKDENQITWSRYLNLPGGVSNYIIFKSVNGGPFLNLATLNGSTLTYTDTLVSDSLKYTYKILAYSSAMNLGSYSDTFFIKNLAFRTPDTAKTIFATVLTTGITNGSVFLQWQAGSKTDTSGLGYNLYEADPTTNVYHLIYKTNSLLDTSYTQTNINTATQAHEYEVTIYNRCGGEGYPGKILLPVQLQAVSNGNLTLRLAWVGYKGVSVLSYNVYRAEGNGTLNLVSVVPPNDTEYVDSNISCNVHYTYQIKTKLSNGLVSLSDTVGATGLDTVMPAKANLYVISVDTTLATGGKISMRFSGNGKPTRSGFNIYRQVNNGSFALYYQLASFVEDTVYWQDQFANTVANRYAYYVSATDSCGNQAAPADTDRSVHVSVQAYSQYMKLKWMPYLGFTNWNYAVEKRTPATAWQKIAGLNDTSLSYIDSNVKCHIFYEYRIRYNDNNSPLFGFSNVAGDTAIDTAAPEISQLQYATVASTSTTKGRIQLAWNPSPTEDVEGYFVYRSADNYIWTLASNMVQGFSYIDSNLNTYQQPYYYKVAPIDSCGNIGHGFSSEHETMVLHAQFGDQKVGLTWNPYIGWKVKTYNIIRDGKVLATVADTINSFTDTLTTCLRYYHYTIRANADSSINLVSYSNMDSAKPYDNVPPAKVYVRSASVDVTAGQVVVSWDSSTAFDLKMYYVYRKRASDGVMVLVDSTTSTIYNEPLTDISGADCYYVFAKDSCGNISDGSNRACLIILQGMNQRTYNSLTWNGYLDWPDGVNSYNIYRDDDNSGWVPISTTPGYITNFNDTALSDDVVDFCYQVEAVENTGTYNALSRSTVICLHQDPYVYIPNAFTPTTSPGINDSFGPKGLFIKSYSMTVYNRWGEVVYQTNSSGKWDGFSNGLVVPDGIYMYVISVESYNNKALRYTGNVMVLY